MTRPDAARVENGSGGSWRAPLFAALLCAGVRAVVALSRLDEQELELYSGSLARALLVGMPLDPEQLPVIPHNRGSVVLGLALTPLFALLGPTLGAIKVLAIGASAATAALFTHLLGRGAGPIAAWVGAVLFALLPPSYQVVDVLALGSHGDSLLWTLLVLVLIGAWAGKLSPLRAVALGTAVGFAGFFSFQCVVALPALLLAWLVRDPGLWKRATTWIAVVVAALWIPAAGYLVPSGEGATIVGQSVEQRFLPDGIGGAFMKLFATLVHQLRASWLYDQHGGESASWLLLLGFAAGGAGLVVAVRARAVQRSLALFVAVYPALIVGAYAVSNFHMELENNLDGMGSRYLMPMLPFLAAWVAIGCEGLARSGRPGLAWLLPQPALVAGGLGVLALAEPGRVADQPTVRGTELPLFHGHIEHAGGDDLAARLEWVERVDPDWPELRPMAYRSFARPDWSTLFGPNAPDPEALWSVPSEERATPMPLREYVLVEFGRRLAAGDGDPAQLAERAAGWPAAERRPVLRGLGAGWLGPAVAQISRRASTDPTGAITFGAILRRTSRFAPADELELFAGMGFQLGSRLTPYQPTLLRALAAGADVLDAERRDAFFREVGRGYRLRFQEEGYRAPNHLRVEAFVGDAEALAAFRSGLEPKE